MRCLGYPFCTGNVEPPSVACRKCWFKIRNRLRNQVTAVIFKSVSRRVRDRALKEAKIYLHRRYAVTLKNKLSVLDYTVVPHRNEVGYGKSKVEHIYDFAPHLKGNRARRLCKVR